MLQVCWEKFNQYFEVEGRYVPVEVDYPIMSVDRIEEYADENTIGEIIRLSMLTTGFFRHCLSQLCCCLPAWTCCSVMK